MRWTQHEVEKSSNMYMYTSAMNVIAQTSPIAVELTIPPPPTKETCS